MVDMNVLPLVDVMLVLLVIFIVTTPLQTHAAQIDLPKASSAINITKPEHVVFGIRTDCLVHYERVAQVMTTTTKAGLVRIGFVSEPNTD